MFKLNQHSSIGLGVLFGVMVSACSPHSKEGHQLVPATQILKNQLPVDLKRNQSVVYLATFTDLREADAHAALVREQGGNVETLDQHGRVQEVTLPEGSLSQVSLPPTASVSLNTPIRIQRNESAPSHQNANREDLVEATLTARKVVGLDALLTRFPEADGRDLKVAVFDTGIDFGVEGVFNDSQGNPKLMGFYDFTGFGKATPTSLETDVPQKNYSIGDNTLRFEDGIAPQKVQSVGILDEKALANAYYGADGIDLDSSKKPNKTFLYAVGVNAEGSPAVWIDLDHDGVISSRDREELTDFNQSRKYIDLRTDVAPSGARPLAVSIASPTSIQFHSVPGGHGTSCGIIIAGDGYANGRLKGMAPRAKLLSYVLDVTGQDVYTLDQLIRSFEHAKSQNVNAISISWGFTTADLESARFLSEFLDREIASAGIIIGMATGNDGPGVSSGNKDDYIPHYGFGVGAMVSKDQAKNTYGWVGKVEDSVIYYSNFGPTRGGRQTPDVISPLMTWVRGERGVSGDQFRAFGGTSSATPALIGAVTALTSALKQNGEEQIDARVMKLAILNSAKPLTHTEAIRQGSGVIQVDAAYDIYKRLISEVRAANRDSKKRTPFAYDLRAKTQLQDSSSIGEGIHSFGYISNAVINVSMTESSLKRIDPLVVVEPMILEHEAQFFQIPSVLSIQGGDARFVIEFSSEIANIPGVYSDVISVRRPSDGITLLQIPVVIEIPAVSHQSNDNETFLANVDRDISPSDVVRHVFSLTQPSSIVFEGMIHNSHKENNAQLSFSYYGSEGTKIYEQSIDLKTSSQFAVVRTPVLPAGSYHCTISKKFGRSGAVLENSHLFGQFRIPYVEVTASSIEKNQISLMVLSRENLNVTQASLHLTGNLLSTHLIRTESGNGVGAAPAFTGSFQVDQKYKECDISLQQSKFDEALHPALNVSLAFLSDAKETLYRGWVDIDKTGANIHKKIKLNSDADRFSIVAYPNIVHWEKYATNKLTLDLGLPFKEKLTSDIKLKAQDRTFSPHKLNILRFQFDGKTLKIDPHVTLYGQLNLLGSSGDVLEQVSVIVRNEW